MLVRALIQTSLVLWFARQSLQGGVRPQSVSWGRVLPARGVGIGVKPGVVGALGALGSRYGTKAMKTGTGRYSGAQLGAAGYRTLGLGSRVGLKQGGYGAQGAYGASLGTGLTQGVGLTNGLGLGQAGKRVYGGGIGALPGYGTLAGVGYPGARPGFVPGAGGVLSLQGANSNGFVGGTGTYQGASLVPGGYGTGLGQGAYLGGAAGKLGTAAALGQGGYSLGVSGKSDGYGEGATGHLGAVAGNGFGYGNGYSNGYGAALGAEGLGGQLQGVYGGGAVELPYGAGPIIPSGLESEGVYPYAAQQLSLGSEGAKAASKYGENQQLCEQETLLLLSDRVGIPWVFQESQMPNT
ncbi:glycine-rich cell wall structural protein 1.0-like [Thalassophryne amazonica]|uniref:glycine-rich cell wall structural protein 1.0-like n=1 Tax=Thalassophryne amazonica TaxID=390379 RepID=UPI00147172F8|nr:glycine-rich cell wall structural protein 1.0-like [Thalassophryne amazonica]